MTHISLNCEKRAQEDWGYGGGRIGNFNYLFSLHKALIANLLTENDGAYCKWVKQGSWHQDELSIKVGMSRN